MTQPRLAIVAPFARGKGFGGSQRLTTTAERLEKRGAAVTWHHVTPTDLTRSLRLRAAARIRPVSVARFCDGAPRADAMSADILLYAHSYLVDTDTLRRDNARGVTSVVDFVDLEWTALADVAQMTRGARRLYLSWQGRLMKRHEVRLAGRAEIALFATRGELEWMAHAQPTAHQLLHVPNRLPVEFELEADDLWRLRRQCSPRAPRLVYMGKVAHRPNHLALLRFLNSDWPGLRRRWPNLRLVVAGRSSSEIDSALRAYSGVEPVGYVANLAPLLADASAAILPFASRAGSSLRVLYYALAGLPLVGPPLAFRGFPAALGLVVDQSSGWEQALGAILDSQADQGNVVARRNLARELQGDSRPWDALHSALLSVSAGIDGSH